jgi:hypothetical protein
VRESELFVGGAHSAARALLFCAPRLRRMRGLSHDAAPFCVRLAAADAAQRAQTNDGARRTRRSWWSQAMTCTTGRSGRGVRARGAGIRTSLGACCVRDAAPVLGMRAAPPLTRAAALLPRFRRLRLPHVHAPLLLLRRQLHRACPRRHAQPLWRRTLVRTCAHVLPPAHARPGAGGRGRPGVRGVPR